MSLNAVPTAERVHIGILGKRNAGKSSLINAITSQKLAIVSEYKGTTTDPVYKAMELLPLGPVMFIDTPGIDDEGELGRLRIEKTYQVINKCDIVLFVIDGQVGFSNEDKDLWSHLQENKLPTIIIVNKIDNLTEAEKNILAMQVSQMTEKYYFVSTLHNTNIQELKEGIAALCPKKLERPLVNDLFNPSDIIILVTPIDSAAPKGRLILPQQQVLRDILDHQGIALVVQETELADTLTKLNTLPQLVITDSQAFAKVNKIVPPDILLTSFSILLARYKNTLYDAVKAVRALDNIKSGDKILISEGCTHHRQCQDIGTVKLPSWIKNYTGCEPQFIFTSGREFPQNLQEYKLIIHCGACMLNEKEMAYRNNIALEQNVPMTNYGIAIAYMHGILKRTLSPFTTIRKLLD